MTQDELDRLLADSLNVEPSPAFVARVRARVGAERLGSGRQAWWQLATLAAGILALVAGGLMFQHDDAMVSAPGPRPSGADGRDQGTSRVALEPPTPVRQAAPAAATPAAREARSEAVRHPGRVATGIAETATRSAEALPPVLIAPEDSDGIRLLLAFTGPATAAPHEDDGFQAPLRMTRIDVAPIAVDSLPELTPLATGELQ